MGLMRLMRLMISHFACSAYVLTAVLGCWILQAPRYLTAITRPLLIVSLTLRDAVAVVALGAGE